MKVYVDSNDLGEKIKILKIANADKNSHIIAGGNAIWYRHSSSFLPVTHTLSI